jgi:DNA-binding Lrp family transcriptional regulator
VAQDPGLSVIAKAWFELRRAQLELGVLWIEVGHRDILALPGGLPGLPSRREVEHCALITAQAEPPYGSGEGIREQISASEPYAGDPVANQDRSRRQVEPIEYPGGQKPAQLLAKLTRAPEGRVGEAELNARRQLVLGLVATLKTLIAQVNQLERQRVIRGYKTVVDWDRLGDERVVAFIDVSVSPQREVGFDQVAARIYRHPEVRSAHLVSGGHDLRIIVEAPTMREIAQFVSEKLAPIDHVTATNTSTTWRRRSSSVRATVS